MRSAGNIGSLSLYNLTALQLFHLHFILFILIITYLFIIIHNTDSPKLAYRNITQLNQKGYGSIFHIGFLDT